LKVTIAEVASRAGVGVATVSRVLNGSPAVSEKTRKRVRAVIDELGYEPSAAARALSTGRTRTVGVVTPFFTQPSVVERLRGVSREISEGGYQLVLFDLARPDRLGRLQVGGRIDGLLCVSMCPSEPDLARLRSAGIAVVLVDCEHPELASVAIDDTAGGRIAAEHLLELGHRRIAFVGDDEDSPWGFQSSALRRVGAAAALAEAGARLIVRRGPHGRVHARSLAARLLALDDPPTAIFAGSDLQAVGVLEAAEAASVDVPDDLSVIGFDDVELARYVGLTTIAQPLETSGAQGARLLMEALGGAPRRTSRLDLRLVRRSTTAPRGKSPATRMQKAPARGRRGTRARMASA
jgi:LacI family transcriptional regulator, galactose operon repressor